MFQRVGVFAGGFTLGAATAVAGDGDDILAELEALVTSSLVRSEAGVGDVPRFTMLETVREFALEQLAASGETEAFSRRHAGHFSGLAQASAANLADADAGAWLARLEIEQANLRVALGWLRARGLSTQGLRLATALGPFWRLRSASAEGGQWLETFLAATGDSGLSAPEHVAALRWAGEMAGLQGDMATAEARLDASLALARWLGDRHGIAAAVGTIGSVCVQRGDVAGSIPLFSEGAMLAQEVGDRRLAAFLLAYLAYAVGHQGDLAQAEAHMARSTALLRALGDVRSFEADFGLMVKGWLAVMRGDREQAAEHFAAALALGRALDAKANLAAILPGLGELAMVRGEIEAASAHYREGLVLGWEGNFPPGVAFNLQGLVRVATRSGDFGRAARFAGALEAHGAAIHVMPPCVVARYEAALACLEAALGDKRYASEKLAGGRMTMPEAVEAATTAVQGRGAVGHPQ